MTTPNTLPYIPQEEFEFYIQQHLGKKMVIKLSGGVFEKEFFPQLIQTIHFLLETDITVFLVFGGGVQIDRFYEKNATTPRKKNDGVGVTTREVLEKGVLPAYDFLIKILQHKFSDMPFSCNVLSPSDLQVISCASHKNLGYVGNPKQIILDNAKSLHIIGFVGEDETGQCYNVNADEIALSITKEEKIDEVIFITGTGGILDSEGNIISKVSDQDLKNMIEGKFLKVCVSGGMKKKCQEIRELLKRVPKVAMAKSETLQQELFTHKGAGTLCVRD